MSTAMVTGHPNRYNSRDEPQHDVAAEQSVLGAMMLSPDAIADVLDVLDVHDFYVPAHATVFESICELYAGGKPTDPISVGDELDRAGALIRIGGAPYLHTLIATPPVAASVGYHAEIVAEKAQRRRYEQAGHMITQYGAAGAGTDIPELIERAQTALDAVTNGRAATVGYTTLSDMHDTQRSLLEDVQAGRIEPGVPTGFMDLDDMLDGLEGGHMVVVAGRPGSGKSTLGVDIARHVAFHQGHTAAVFSLEMSRTELWRRIVCAEAKIRHDAIKKPGELIPADWDRINSTITRLRAGGQFIIDDTPGMTPTQIRAKSRRIKARHGLKVIVVDYMQLMTSGKRVESRQAEVAEFSRQIKLLAKELDVPVIAISQLNRSPEQRADKRPMLSDLRESGALEQDTDIAILVHRPSMYERDDPRAGEVDLIVAKNRSGRTGTIVLAEQLHYCRFMDLAPER